MGKIKKIFNYYINSFSSARIQSVVVVVVFVVILILFSFGQISFNDFFWHLAVGKWMFTTQSFLTHDIFSLAFQGKEWLNNTWLFDGALYLIYTTAGYWGLSLLRLIIFSTTYWFLYKTVAIKYKPPILIIVSAFLVTIPIIRNFLRPEILSPMFLAFTLYALYNHKYKHSKLIWLLPLVTILWVNSHGSFTLAPILIGIFFFSDLLRGLVRKQRNIVHVLKGNRSLKTYFLVGILTCLATFINPYGYRIYEFIHVMLSDIETLSHVSEWNPVSWKYFFFATIDERITYVVSTWLAILLLAMQAKRLWQIKYSIKFIAENFLYEDALLLALAVYSALQYVRGLHVLALIAIVVTLKGVHLLIRSKQNTTTHPLHTLAICGGLLFVLSYHHGFTLNTGPGALYQSREVINFILTHKPKGNFINEYADGGNLIWSLYPTYHVLIDGRTANVYNAPFYWYYRNMTDDRVFETLLNRHNLTFAIIPHYWDMGQFLAEKGWKLVFFDNYAAVYLRDVEENKELITSFEYSILKPRFDKNTMEVICSDPIRKNTLAQEMTRNMREVNNSLTSLLLLGQYVIECDGDQRQLTIAERVLKHAVRIKPKTAELHHYLGLLQLKLGKDSDALKNFSIAAHLNENRENLTGIGIALHNLRNYTKAERAFQKIFGAPGITPDEFYQIYGWTSYQLDNNERAIDMLQRYIDIIGEEHAIAQDYMDLSNAYNDAGNNEKAQEYLEKAQSLLKK